MTYEAESAAAFWRSKEGPEPEPLTSDLLREWQWEVPRIIEDLGRICASMRAGVGAIEAGCQEAGLAHAADAAAAIPGLVGKLALMRSDLEKYAI